MIGTIQISNLLFFFFGFGFCCGGFKKKDFKTSSSECFKCLNYLFELQNKNHIISCTSTYYSRLTIHQ